MLNTCHKQVERLNVEAINHMKISYSFVKCFSPTFSNYYKFCTCQNNFGTNQKILVLNGTLKVFHCLCECFTNRKEINKSRGSDPVASDSLSICQAAKRQRETKVSTICGRGVYSTHRLN